MPYDEARAARYDEAHAARFAEAGTVATALVALLPAAGGAAGGVPGGAAGGAGRILELGVGTGRLAIPLAATGADVWGIDASEPMLARLRAKPGGGRVNLVAGDFTAPDELVEGPFDLAFVAFNTLFELPTQAAQLRCLAGVAALLGPGGVLVVEALAPDLTRLEQTVSALAVTVDTAVLQATRHDPATQLVTGADVTVTAAGSVSLSPWSIRYVSVPELDLMARLGGLRLRTRWGGWHREPFSSASTTHVSVYERGQP